MNVVQNDTESEDKDYILKMMDVPFGPSLFWSLSEWEGIERENTKWRRKQQKNARLSSDHGKKIRFRLDGDDQRGKHTHHRPNDSNHNNNNRSNNSNNNNNNNSQSANFFAPQSLNPINNNDQSVNSKDAKVSSCLGPHELFGAS